jgi:hypothetical protein
MKILILHLFVGSVLLMGSIQPPARHTLSRRLAALRFRAAYRKNKVHQ